MSRVEVTIRGSAGDESAASLTFSDERPWTLEFDHPRLPVQRYENSDLFECMVELRAFLEERGYRLLCNGARMNIYASPLSRQSSGGKKAHLVRLGEVSTRTDLVNIFAPTNADTIGTVTEQESFIHAWFQSLKGSSHG